MYIKKTLLLSLTIFILSACSNDNLEQQEQATNNEEVTSDDTETEDNNNTQNVESTEIEDTESNDTDNNNVQNTEQMISQFIEDMYTKNSLEDYRNVDEIVSEDFKQMIDEQFSDTLNEDDIPDTEVRTQNAEIYKSTSNRNDEYIYVLDLEIIDHDTRNISKSQNIGRVAMVEEYDVLKIDDIAELSNTEIDE